jgi:hypothetical protein
MSIRNKTIFTDAALAFIENTGLSEADNERVIMLAELIGHDPSERGAEVRLGEALQAYRIYMSNLAGKEAMMQELAKVWEAPDGK